MNALQAWTTLHSKIIRLTAKISKLEDETMKILFARVSPLHQTLCEFHPSDTHHNYRCQKATNRSKKLWALSTSST